MSSYGSVTDNHDGTKNFNAGIVKQDGANTTSVDLFQNNYNENQFKKSNAGASLNFKHEGNPATAGSLSVQNFPKMGNTATAAASLGVGSPTHRVAVDTFATRTMPNQSHSFTTVGANIDAQMGRMGANAGIAHTPRFNSTEQSLGARLNLHQSPTGSLNLGVGSSRIVTPNHTSPWNHNVMLRGRKEF